ncbi:transposase [Streptomyces chilikensis]|uniref:transposase n=1 Tax=Streptomyces chilikensis TaxID=1194079 RepID=UPI003F4CF098
MIFEDGPQNTRRRFMSVNNHRHRPKTCRNVSLLTSRHCHDLTAAKPTHRNSDLRCLPPLLFRRLTTVALRPANSPTRRRVDSAYAGALVDWSKERLDIKIKTVRRAPEAKGFVVLPRRWAVERSLSWIMRARRHCRDHERLPQVSESLITWTSLTPMTRRLTRKTAQQSRRAPLTTAMSAGA